MSRAKCACGDFDAVLGSQRLEPSPDCPPASRIFDSHAASECRGGCYHWPKGGSPRGLRGSDWTVKRGKRVRS